MCGSKTSRTFVSFPEGEEGCGVTAQAAEWWSQRGAQNRGVLKTSHARPTWLSLQNSVTSGNSSLVSKEILGE